MLLKRCIKCLIEKPITDFYQAPSCRDKLHPRCKTCFKQGVQQARLRRGVAARRERERQCYYRRTKHYKEKRKQWGLHTGYQYLRDKQKLSAKAAVKYAVKIGKLTRQPCQVCGDTNVHAHHTDYTRKLDVVWLCPLHHGFQHRKAVA